MVVGFVASAATVSESTGTYDVCIRSIASGAIDPAEPDVPFTITVDAITTAQGIYSSYVWDLLGVCNEQLFCFSAEGLDYSFSTALTFVVASDNVVSTTQCVTVSILDDSELEESPETLVLTLTADTTSSSSEFADGVSLSLSILTINIYDDDGKH